MTLEPDKTAGQPESEEVVDAEVASAAERASGTDDATAAEQASGVEQDLNQLIEEARSQRDEYLELAQRTKADFDNYRKRMATESQGQVEKGRLDVAGDLLEALDNLERVLEAAGIDQRTALEGEIPTESSITEQGVIVIYRDLVGVLRKAGVEAFDSKGETFDPNLHEAIQALPAEGVEPGVVIEVMQKGYRAGENVLRHARVVVSQ